MSLAQAAYATPSGGPQIIIKSGSGTPMVMKVEGAVPPGVKVKPPAEKPDSEKKDGTDGKDGEEEGKGKEKPDGEKDGEKDERTER